MFRACQLDAAQLNRISSRLHQVHWYQVQTLACTDVTTQCHFSSSKFCVLCSVFKLMFCALFACTLATTSPLRLQYAPRLEHGNQLQVSAAQDSLGLYLHYKEA